MDLNGFLNIQIDKLNITNFDEYNELEIEEYESIFKFKNILVKNVVNSSQGVSF